MSKSVVTGGSGFIGSHLIDRLLDLGEEVVCLDRSLGPNLRDAEKRPGFSFVAADVSDASALARAIDGSVAAIYHLAAVVGVRNYISDPLGVLDVNVIGTRNVLQVAQSTGSRVILASTSEVFGRNPKIPWEEDDDRVLGSTRVDRWSYSTSKAMAEHLAFAMHRHRGLPVTVVRYFNAYGPRQAPIFVVSQAVHRVLRGEPPVMYDEGDQTRCFTYVADAVEGTIAAASRPEAIGEAFNLGNAHESTVREAIDTVLTAAGSDLQPQRLATSAHYGDTYEDIPRRVPAVAKAARMLGWSATTDLASGIRSTIDWAGANRWWLRDSSPASVA